MPRDLRDVERGLPRNACTPGSFDLSQYCWVDNPMPEWSDERHVSLSQPTAWLDVDGHLSSIGAFALIDPSQVHHGVHDLVRQFRRGQVTTRRACVLGERRVAAG
jgi:hypothetical protein